ncbi:MAG: GNAT family N-acetyltransferase [bacterium]|nr:GNAT family N-acetyltransferase [bacterium]
MMEEGISTAMDGAASSCGDYVIRPLASGDEGSLLVSFPAAFGKERSLPAWRWAYRDNPFGTRVFVAEHEGAIVAQYAAWPMPTWVDGMRTSFCQIVDSMVHPAHRAGLKRPGLFVRVAEAFFDAYGGETDEVYYGWPVRANWRIGERYLGYERVGSQLVLTRPLVGTSPSLGEVVRIERFGDEARWLYERCVGDWGASTIRDARYLNWRYVDRPEHEYLRLAVREPGGALRGLCVARVADFGGERVALIADWLVPADEAAIAPVLLAALDASGRAGGATATAAFLPAWSPWFESFQGLGFRVAPTAYDLVARTYGPRIDGSFLRRHWWYQLGDTDLV